MIVLKGLWKIFTPHTYYLLITLIRLLECTKASIEHSYFCVAHSKWCLFFLVLCFVGITFCAVYIGSIGMQRQQHVDQKEFLPGDTDDLLSVLSSCPNKWLQWHVFKPYQAMKQHYIYFNLQVQILCWVHSVNNLISPSLVLGHQKE